MEILFFVVFLTQMLFVKLHLIITTMKKALPIALGLIVLVSLFRILPHPYNFTPVGAIAIFSGAYLSKRVIGWLFPIAIMLISDTILEITTGFGFHKDMWAVYGSFALMILLGQKILSGRTTGKRVLGASVLGSVLFFLLTNFSSWLIDPSGIYANSLSGLIAAYAAAIPFYNVSDPLSSFALNGLLGDLFFSGALFGAYALIVSPKNATTPVVA